ncbi:MAG TPA: protein kinase, partial [Pirellulales bacterium]|nr:protein kinase [Pirellulales bacterium]
RIRDHHVNTPQNRARFLLEAEVTGGLEHPGIVPVYSLGTSDDGRPFYAMRLIRGRSLREAIDHYHSPDAANADSGARLLELRQLLDRFMAVCNAIEYAHSRGVLHRDLKPENIMLGAYGETLVVDWGLAKPLAGADSAQRDVDRLPAFEGDTPASRVAAAGGLADQTLDEPLWRPSASSSATQMGSAIGTPAYMSPEQAAGRLDDIGRASDVYSLGATLYCLLTGRPPFDDSELGRLLDRVRRGDFPPPRSVHRSVPAALQAVCLKAMALDPAGRYASPQDLAGDVERWLADEPVLAYGAPWHERLAHWARRHRRGVQSGVAALAVVSAVSLAAALVVHSAKLQVERERVAERDAKEEARRAIDNFVNLVTEEPALNDAALRHLRQRLLADALTYYEELIDKHGGEEHLRHELAGAILRVGRINHRTGFQGEARKAFQEALKLFEELVRQHPDHEQYQSELSVAYKNLGLLQREAGDCPAALTYFEQALEVKQRLADREPDNPAYRSSLAAALADVAEALHALGRDDDSRTRYEQAVDQQRRALEHDPRNSRYEQSLGRYQQRLEELGLRSTSVENGRRAVP